MLTLHIIYRCCAVIGSRGSSIRPFNINKIVLIKKCLHSLLQSCKGFEKRIIIDIVDDSSSKEFLKDIEEIIRSYHVKFKINRLMCKNGGITLEYAYKLADKSKYDLIYFCQDDYFHLKQAIPAILNAFEDKIIYTNNFAIFPSDYPKLYNEVWPSLIFMSKYGHWRSLDMSDGTMIIPRKLFKKHKNIFFEFANFNKKGYGGEKETINKLFQKKIPAIAPIETLTAHWHKTTLPKLIDWKSEIEKIKI